MAVTFFDLKKQNQALEGEITAAVAQVIKSGHFILGPNVAEFEKEVAAYCGTKYAVGVASGTDALLLALKACGIKEGDEVITSPFTFIATAEVIASCGATPVFADIEPNSFTINPAEIEKKITKKTRAIIPVHLYGHACQMDQIMALAKKHSLKVIEDCAQAIGTKYKNKFVGSFGDAGAFSFFPTKNLGGFGDGGIITTNEQHIAEELKVLRNHGSRKTYHHDLIGYNSRLDEIQAAVLRIKLRHLESYAEARRKNADFYYKNLKNIKQLVLPSEAENTHHIYNQFTIKVSDRERLHEHLKSKGIGSMIYYPISLHQQNAFAPLGYKTGDFPQSEAIQNQVLSLPIYPEITEAELQEVCFAIRDFYKA